jgi:tRNA threonylcarbamoyladenosine biosynthesis protein TsaE
MSPMERLETGSAEETEALAADLAASLRPGDVILLSGDLGTGKTTFVRGACRALGVDGPITSPTFTIGQLYRGGPEGRAIVSHLDLYRLGSLADEDPGLLDPYLDRGLIVFVEWPPEVPEEIAAALGAVRARIGLEHVGDDRRSITVER